MRKSIRITALVLGVLLAVSLLACYYAAVSIYSSNFDSRYTTSSIDAHDMEEFPMMTRQRHSFQSHQKQMLVGYLYQNRETSDPHMGLVVFAHGLGSGGQRGYMDIFDYLTQKGYDVFAYDATANDESEGDAVGGLPQGYIDLDYALSYVKTLEEGKDRPIFLMGYSWGAISVTNVLNYHPDVNAVAAFAGCNRSLDLIEDRGRQIAGDKSMLLTPFAAAYEFFRYGEYAFSTAMKGFENSDCGVMIVHGRRDTTVPIQYGYDLYYDKYGQDPRFEFIEYPGRGHDVMRNSVGWLDTELMDRMIEFFDRYR